MPADYNTHMLQLVNITYNPVFNEPAKLQQELVVYKHIHVQ